MATLWILFLMNYPPVPDERIIYKTEQECRLAAEEVKKKYIDWRSPLPFCIPTNGHP